MLIGWTDVVAFHEVVLFVAVTGGGAVREGVLDGHDAKRPTNLCIEMGGFRSFFGLLHFVINSL